MINFDGVTKESMKEHNPNQPQIPDLLQRIFKICITNIVKQTHDLI